MTDFVENIEEDDTGDILYNDILFNSHVYKNLIYKIPEVYESSQDIGVVINELDTENTLKYKYCFHVGEGRDVPKIPAKLIYFVYPGVEEDKERRKLNYLDYLKSIIAIPIAAAIEFFYANERNKLNVIGLPYVGYDILTNILPKFSDVTLKDLFFYQYHDRILEFDDPRSEMELQEKQEWLLTGIKVLKKVKEPNCKSRDI